MVVTTMMLVDLTGKCGETENRLDRVWKDGKRSDLEAEAEDLEKMTKKRGVIFPMNRSRVEECATPRARVKVRGVVVMMVMLLLLLWLGRLLIKNY